MTPFVSATYFKETTGDAIVTTEASTTLTAYPADFNEETDACDFPGDTAPAGDTASTLTAVGAALILAAIF